MCHSTTKGNTAGPDYVLERLCYAGKEGGHGAEEDRAGGEASKCCRWSFFSLPQLLLGVSKQPCGVQAAPQHERVVRILRTLRVKSVMKRHICSIFRLQAALEP